MIQEKKNQYQLIAHEMQLNIRQVEQTIQLLEAGATIPFIARYRKEKTGSLDEVAIAGIQLRNNRLNELEKRKESILQSIEEQGKLTDDLKKRILDCYDMTTLEDLYLPYKRKKKTRASVAREKGLEPLALEILEQKRNDLERLAAPYVNEHVPTIEEALEGARDILAELINEDETARAQMRRLFEKEALITSKVAKGKDTEGVKYKDYFEFSEPVSKCPSHRLLAIRRGEEEGFLRVTIEPGRENAIYLLEKRFIQGRGPLSEQVGMAIADGYDRLMQPSIETVFRQSSKEKADDEAIRVFSENLRQLLLAAPLGQNRVMGIDPGFRTGCKVVCLDESGNLLHNTAIFPHPPQSDSLRAARLLAELAEHHHIEAIAVGNGTAGRETMAFLRGVNFQIPVKLFMVSESGASIYSASEVARDEFPDYDATVRGAVSIGRRLMDPLAELVKIDAKSIGVGQYQHDVNQAKLKESLDRQVESCVNLVGVNINTASKHLLTYVSGLGPVLAQNIVTYRTENGKIESRLQLRKIPRMGEKAYEQAAGFLRIRDGKNPLDNTAVHPESYGLVSKMAADLNCSVEDLIANPELRKQIQLSRYVTENTGLPTLQDILRELAKPGLDPRGEANTFEFADVHSMDDLYTGLILPGIVTNITNFGAFVDIGIKQDGLVHVSNLANRFIKNPAEVVALQQQVVVKVIDVDRERNRIYLSMKDV